jgi:hypothetical protein
LRSGYFGMPRQRVLAYRGAQRLGLLLALLRESEVLFCRALRNGAIALRGSVTHCAALCEGSDADQGDDSNSGDQNVSATHGFNPSLFIRKPRLDSPNGQGTSSAIDFATARQLDARRLLAEPVIDARVRRVAGGGHYRFGGRISCAHT